jgi:hypothetical protein
MGEIKLMFAWDQAVELSMLRWTGSASSSRGPNAPMLQGLDAKHHVIHQSYLWLFSHSSFDIMDLTFVISNSLINW